MEHYTALVKCFQVQVCSDADQSFEGFIQKNKLTEPVDGWVLHEVEVVLGQGGEEDDGGHVLETVDPLPPLRPRQLEIYGHYSDKEIMVVRIYGYGNTDL